MSDNLLYKQHLQIGMCIQKALCMPWSNAAIKWHVNEERWQGHSCTYSAHVKHTYMLYKCSSLCGYVSIYIYVYVTWWSVGAVDLLNLIQLSSGCTSASHICPWYQHQWHRHLPLVGLHICIALNEICNIERWVTLQPMTIGCHRCGQRQSP